MSTVRYFDDIPHIGRFGMRNAGEGTSWTLFYRNGTRFTIHVDQKDVSGTAFHSLWRPLLEDDPKQGESILDHYNKFFDLVLLHSLSTLQKMNPVKPHWITLRDYLHTPAYHLKLVADNTGADGVHAVVTKGPDGVTAYEFRPTTTFKNMPQNVPKYSSSDLIALDKETDWRLPPHKFRTSDGLICYFKACELDSRQVETGKVTNRSLDSIEAHLYLYKYGREMDDSCATRRSGVLGIVTDVASVSDKSGRATENKNKETTRDIVAGILLTSPTRSPYTQTLGDVVAQTEAPDGIFTKRARLWRTQIEGDVAYLHSIGIYWGGREDWYYINQHTVMIDSESGDACLTLDTATFLDNNTDERTEKKSRKELTDMDSSAVENVFTKWLPGELSKRTDIEGRP